MGEVGRDRFEDVRGDGGGGQLPGCGWGVDVLFSPVLPLAIYPSLPMPPHIEPYRGREAEHYSSRRRERGGGDAPLRRLEEEAPATEPGEKDLVVREEPAPAEEEEVVPGEEERLAPPPRSGRGIRGPDAASRDPAMRSAPSMLPPRPSHSESSPAQLPRHRAPCLAEPSPQAPHIPRDLALTPRISCRQGG